MGDSPNSVTAETESCVLTLDCAVFLRAQHHLVFNTMGNCRCTCRLANIYGLTKSREIISPFIKLFVSSQYELFPLVTRNASKLSTMWSLLKITWCLSLNKLYSQQWQNAEVLFQWMKEPHHITKKNKPVDLINYPTSSIFWPWGKRKGVWRKM